ncbi:MAG: hypothetical protein LBE55_07080 [Clostridiales bacterium]|jgi:hypothetical protein|nr:hypothetical protein [Clostridiales bacterium]
MGENAFIFFLFGTPIIAAISQIAFINSMKARFKNLWLAMVIIPGIIAAPTAFLIIRFHDANFFSREAAYVIGAMLFGVPGIFSALLAGVITIIVIKIKKSNKG